MKRATYTWSERQRRAQVVRAHREAYGNVCPGYQREPHPAADLTADHVYPVGAGGPEDGPLQVLCRSCNATKRDGRQRPTTRRSHRPRHGEWQAPARPAPAFYSDYRSRRW